MIVIHEFGHFIVAKMLGIAVETFSVGFGPRLLGFRIGETDYRLSAVPLGGYVKFRGENPEMLAGGERGLNRWSFSLIRSGNGFLVAVAGPAFNIATAILIPAIGMLIGFRDSADQVQKPISWPCGQPARPPRLAGSTSGRSHSCLPRSTESNVARYRTRDGYSRPDEEVPVQVERSGTDGRSDLNLRPIAPPDWR
jgi:regulator of sigma E protease